MDMTIRYGRDMSPGEFNTLLELDKKVFGDKILTNEGMAYKRFLKFRDSIIAVYSGDMVMGFTCFFNVDRSVYERAFYQQEIIDDNLSENEVMPLSKEHENHILLLDMVVDEAYRNRGIAKLLNGLIGDYLKKKCSEGYKIGTIFGFSVTSGGLRILSSFGSRLLWNKSGAALMEINKDIFMYGTNEEKGQPCQSE